MSMVSRNLWRKYIHHGDSHLLVLSDGKVYGKGSNSYNQLGQNYIRKQNDHFQLIGPKELKDEYIVEVSAGGWHTLMKERSGRIYGTGHQGSNRMALLQKNRISKIGIQRIDEDLLEGMNEVLQKGKLFMSDLRDLRIFSCWWSTFFLFPKKNGRMLFGGGLNVRSSFETVGNTKDQDMQRIIIPTKELNAGEFVVDICGGFSFFMLTNQGNVLSAGQNNKGVLGHGFSKENDKKTLVKIQHFEKKQIFVKKVVTGATHALFLDTKNRLFFTGQGSTGLFVRTGPSGKGADVCLPTEVTLPGMNSVPRFSHVDACYGCSHLVTLDNEIVMHKNSDTSGKESITRFKLLKNFGQDRKQSFVDIGSITKFHLLLRNGKVLVKKNGFYHCEGMTCKIELEEGFDADLQIEKMVELLQNGVLCDCSVNCSK